MNLKKKINMKKILAKTTTKKENKAKKRYITKIKLKMYIGPLVSK